MFLLSIFTVEKLIIHQLDTNINVPSNLDFDCPDRSQLLDQLKVLQIVLRRERNSSNKNSDLNNLVSPLKSNDCRATESNDLKSKIERHKQAAEEKRQNKLKKMDSNAPLPIDSLLSKKSPVNRKRQHSNTNPNQSNKKSKNLEVEPDKSSSYSDLPSQSSSSSKKTDSSPRKSFIESFAATDKRKIREQIRDQAIAKMRQAGERVKFCEPGEFALKFVLSAPYHYFFNRVENSEVTHNQQFTASFPELLDVSLGEIEDSLHINFMVEIGWLCLQYLLAAQNPKMTIFCGEVCDPQCPLPSNIDLVKVSMPTPYGCHHSKISVLKYSDGGIRIIVSTANIYSDDWENRTQG